MDSTTQPDLIEDLRSWQFICDNIEGEAFLIMKSGRIFKQAADEIERLLSVIADMEESIPKLIEGARKPLLDEIEKLSTGGVT
jgi:hypothetical protein